MMQHYYFFICIFVLQSLGPPLQFANAVQYSRMCALDNSVPPVPLQFDEIAGSYSVYNETTLETHQVFGRKLSSKNNKENNLSLQKVKMSLLGVWTTGGTTNFLRGNVPVQNSPQSRELGHGSHGVQSHTEHNVYMARPCPCDESGQIYCLVEGTRSGPVADTCGIPADSEVITVSSSENGSGVNMTWSPGQIECFELGSQTVFIRNAWPVVVLWYGALFIFLIATENGKYARGFLLHKFCPSLRTNEMQVERILERENQMRDRLRAAAVRANNLADGPGRYLIRTRGMRLPTRLGEDATDDEREEATRQWIEQAEALGIFNAREVVEMERANRPQRREYVLKTKKFDSKKERMKRENLQSSSGSGCDNEDNEDGLSPENDESVSTPVKKNANKEGSGPGTPETVASAEDYEVNVDASNEELQSSPASGSDSKTTNDTIQSNTDAANEESPNTNSPLFQSADDDIPATERISGEQQPETTQNADVFDDEEDTFDCTICLAPVEDGEDIGVMQCNHIFHAECLRSWCQRKNACPLCQTEIATPRPIESENNVGGSESNNAGGAPTNNPTITNNARGNTQRASTAGNDANVIQRPSTILFSSRIVNPTPRRSTLTLNSSSPRVSRGRTLGQQRGQERGLPRRYDDFW